MEMMLNQLQFSIMDMQVVSTPSEDGEMYNFYFKYYLRACMIRKFKIIMLISAFVVPLIVFYIVGRYEQEEMEKESRKIDDETKHEPLIDKV